MPHIHEKIDYTVEAFIVYNNKVLLRRHDKYNMWLSVGGHVELDEDFNQAAVRESKEEVGLDITLIDTRLVPAFKEPRYVELIPPAFLNRHHVSDTHEHVSATYIAYSTTDTITEGEQEKSSGTHWFTKEELNDPSWGILERVKIYAETALDTVQKYNETLKTTSEK